MKFRKKPVVIEAYQFTRDMVECVAKMQNASPRPQLGGMK